MSLDSIVSLDVTASGALLDIAQTQVGQVALDVQKASSAMTSKIILTRAFIADNVNQDVSQMHILLLLVANDAVQLIIALVTVLFVAFVLMANIQTRARQAAIHVQRVKLAPQEVVACVHTANFLVYAKLRVSCVLQSTLALVANALFVRMEKSQTICIQNANHASMHMLE